MQIQIRNRKRTYLFIVPEDHSTYFGGEISEIRTGIEFKAWGESNLVPKYYKKFSETNTNTEITYWFLLTSYGKIDPLKYEEYVKPLFQHSRKNYGSVGRPFPSLCEYCGDKELEAFFLLWPSKRTKGKDDNWFARREAFWRICYEGKEVLLPHLIGLSYISLLLSQPNKNLYSFQLEQLITSHNSPSPKTKYLQEMSNQQLEKEEVLHKINYVGSYLKTAKFNDDSFGVIQNKIDDITDQIEDAKMNGDQKKVVKLLKEKEHLETISKIVQIDLKGKDTLEYKDFVEKPRQRVSKSINRALKKIKKEHPKLHEHLVTRKTLQKGKMCSYTPDPIITWKT